MASQSQIGDNLASAFDDENADKMEEDAHD